MSAESLCAPVASVTGANKGIGPEMVRRLVNAGYRVYLTARGSEQEQAAAVRFLELEVTSDESVRRAAGSVEQAEGTWTLLVNNAVSLARCVTRTTTRPTTWPRCC